MSTPALEIPASVLQGPKGRRTIRGAINPMDKSTVVSIFPKHITERKWTIQPGFFELQPGSFEKPSVLVVGSSSWWRDISPDEPLLEIPQSSIQIADSIVKDYCNGIVGCNMADAMPGLFYIPGAYTPEKILKGKVTFPDGQEIEGIKLLEVAKKKQENWYRTLIKITDILWARTNGNPVTVNEDARIGVKILGLDRDWAKDFHAPEVVRCFACGSMRDSRYPVCPSCKAIDKNHPAAKDLKFAE